MSGSDAKGFLQLVVVSASLLCSLGHLHTVHYQYGVRFLYQEDCRKCLMNDLCLLRVSQCAMLEFHYFNVTVHNTSANCNVREMLLLLELQQIDRHNGDTVYLEACSEGMDKHHFWNYLACSTITKEGGRDKAFIGCKPNEILSPAGSSTTVNVIPTWVTVVLTVLGVFLGTALLTLCVVAYHYYHYRRTNGQQGNRPEEYHRLDTGQSWLGTLKQWVRDRGLVGPCWFTPTAREHTVAYRGERPRPRGASRRDEQQQEV